MPASQRTNSFLYFFPLLFVLCLAAFNVFYNLDKFSIAGWDEARHGVSAFEMLKQRHFLVHTYRYQPDYSNVKPVLSFWPVMLGYQTAGFTPLGLRFYSALFAWLTIIAVTAFVYRTHGRPASLATAISLSTCTPFIIDHCARTGDADSLFVFLFTAAILALLLTTTHLPWLYVSGMAFALAFLTKSWHAANIAVIIILYLAFSGRHRTLSRMHWVLFFSSMTVPVAVWGLLRYQQDGSVFLKAMVTQDALYRLTTKLEGDVGSIGYYARILVSSCHYWLLGLVLSLTYCLTWRSARERLFDDEKRWMGVVLWPAVPFVLLSLASTKVRWYVLPVYPALCVAIGALAGVIWQTGKSVTRAALVLFVFVGSIYYEWQVFSYVSDPIPSLEQQLISQMRGRSDVAGYNLYYYGHDRKAWPQSIVLAAELADDLTVADGGPAAFAKDPRSLLLVRREGDIDAWIKENALKVIASNRWGAMVVK
ncbi:MAG TPA: glycosyltransferase family 39 protein [Candidatus Eisenbacteria bacterium]|jgi:4-amino-4-deoxy-L-arabinose transferase-like glycosyltransferase